MTILTKHFHIIKVIKNQQMLRITISSLWWVLIKIIMKVLKKEKLDKRNRIFCTIQEFLKNLLELIQKVKTLKERFYIAE